MTDYFVGIKKLVAPEGEIHQIVCENQLIWRRPDKNLNRVLSSIDVDGEIFNNIGYQEGYRLSSSGALKEQNSSVVTGFIPYKVGDIVRMNGVNWSTTVSTGYVYIVFYDKDFAYLSHINRYMEGSTTDKGISNASTTINKNTSSILTDVNNITTFNIKFVNQLDVAYIRISANGKGADMMITINEEII